jgi:hypothetical protein
MSTKFIHWWRANGPKGAANSINALLIITLLRDAEEPMSMQDMHKAIGGMSPVSILGLVTPMREAGFLVREKRHHPTTRRQHYHVFSLSSELREVLAK